MVNVSKEKFGGRLILSINSFNVLFFNTYGCFIVVTDDMLTRIVTETYYK